MKAFLIDGPLAGHVVDLNKVDSASGHWSCSTCWSGLKALRWQYFNTYTTEDESLCVMAVNPELGEDRDLTLLVVQMMLSGEMDQNLIDVTWLEMDAGKITAETLGVLRTIADINLHMLLIQNEALTVKGH